MYLSLKNNKSYLILVIICLMQLLLFSCKGIANNDNDKNNHITIASNSNDALNRASYLTVEYGNQTLDELMDVVKENKKLDIYNNYEIINSSPVEIIVPKNQTNSQSLSIVVNDNLGHLLVFDGGRIEDADYLCDIIKDNGGVVTSWFITHIHDDHIGALYEILSKKRTDIIIKEIVYNFANFDWYYSKMGDDAGIYFLFENAIKDYNEFLKQNNLNVVNILNESNLKSESHQYIFEYGIITKGDSPIFECGTPPRSKMDSEEWDVINTIMRVNMLNDLYLLDKDPINNTSIVYCVEFFYPKKFNLIIFGDLGYQGGNILFDTINENISNNKSRSYYNNILDNTEILVLSHHGQNGIDPELYKKFSPKVVIWPTSKDIYNNSHGRYYTDDTKKVLSEIESIELQIKSYEETAVIR